MNRPYKMSIATVVILIVMIAWKVSLLSQAQTMETKHISTDPDDTVVTTTAVQEIDIKVQYSGNRIQFFGTIPPDSDGVIVKLTSKHNPPVKLVMKGKVIIFWMAVKQFEISGLPFMFKIHASGKIRDLVDNDEIQKYGLSYETLKGRMKLKFLKGKEESQDRDKIFNGYKKMKEKDSLYRIRENSIEVTKKRLFQHSFLFPDKACEGEYVAQTLVVKSGKIIGTSVDTIKIKKVGLEAWLTHTARENGLLYGIMAVCVAVAAGLFVGYIFKGGGH